MIIYIKERKEDNLLEKIKSRLNIIKFVNDNEKIICEIPSNKKSYNHIIKKILSKFNRITAVILSNSLFTNRNIRELLEINSIYIIDGKIIKNVMFYEVLAKIANYIGKRVELLEVSILINNKTDFFIQNIKLIASKVKTLNIVTNNIGVFKDFESNLYDNGILIRVINNKKKSLLRSDVIINMDFTEELINKYSFKSNSVFLNINSNAIIKKKSFNGINIKDITIELLDINKEEMFNDLQIYESSCYGMNFCNIRKQIETDGLFVKEFIGINGILDKKEFKNLV